MKIIYKIIIHTGNSFKIYNFIKILKNYAYMIYNRALIVLTHTVDSL